MPFIHRRGRLFIAREGATYGTALTNTGALVGMQNGPLSGLVTATLGNQATTPGLAMPTLARDFLPAFYKHMSPAQLGRKFEDVAMVPGRRDSKGSSFQVEVMPDTFGLLLLLSFGSDSVAATASSTLSGGSNTANATTLTLAANSNPAMIDGQALWINDAALSEYVYVNGSVAANATSVPIRAGGGTGGGLKNTHVTSTPIQVGPWTHTFTPSAGSPGVFQAEDNWGGAATSLLYKGMLVDSLEFAAPIEKNADAVTATIKALGMAPSSTPVTASPAPSGIPLEEVSIAAGNTPTFTATGATSGTIYVADFKMTLNNNAQVAASQVSAPDPYSALGTKTSLSGSADLVFEDFGEYQDFATNAIWAPAVLTYTWPSLLLKKNPTGIAASLSLSFARFGIEKLGKPTMANDLVHLPIDAWRAMDYPDFTNPVTAVLINNVAAY